jgi:ligand-binding sensor domain-containing protein
LSLRPCRRWLARRACRSSITRSRTGLADNVINKIVRDSRGFLWFFTEEGLSRFDGYTLTNYAVRQSLLRAVTNGVLVRFNPRGMPDPAVVLANDPTVVSRTPMFTVVWTESDDRLSRHYRAGRRT